ncbi:MAG TPA: HEAT repeat domain-containing protein [Planctomycetota bacterium]|nr:HEAT repeat domain-containing protein [Planctomycetota bacterium]
MAALSTESIVPLLESTDPELRWAAAKVLGALKPEGDGIVQALTPLLSADDARLRRAGLEAVAALGADQALDEVTRLLEEPGDLGRRAIEVLAGLGPDVLKHLQKRLDGASETGRRRILTIAARVRGAVGLDLITRALEAGHGESIRALGTRLASELESATTREREALRRRLEAFLDAADPRARPHSVETALDLLVRLDGADAERRLLAFAAAGHPPALRKRALLTLGEIAGTRKLEEEVLQGLFACLEDPDFGSVVSPAMQVLESAKLSAVHAPPLLALLKGHDPALRRFAVTALGQVDTPTSAAALLDVLRGDNPDLQKRAAVALSKQRAAVAPVVAALADAPDAATAWVLARIVGPHAPRLKPEQVTPLAAAGAVWLESGDPRAEAVLHVLRDDHAEALAAANLKRARRIRKDRKGGEIVNLIRPLIRDGAPVPDELRYELAIAEVVRGSKDVLREARLQHPGLEMLETLLHVPDFGVFARLKRDKHLVTPDEYLLIGCHFAERTYADRTFGGDLLRWLAENFPDTGAARAAEAKLMMEGFPPPKPRPVQRKGKGPGKGKPPKNAARPRGRRP